MPDMSHVVVDRGGHGVPTDRLPRRQADEPERVGRGDDVHLVTGEHEQAHQMDRFVGGDPARDSDDDEHPPIFARP